VTLAIAGVESRAALPGHELRKRQADTLPGKFVCYPTKLSFSSDLKSIIKKFFVQISRQVPL
jgi:hypothetical protein